MECKERCALSEDILKDERIKAFADVAKKFKIIPDDTVTVVADPKVADKLDRGIKVSFHELQHGSVSIRKNVQKPLHLQGMELPHLKHEQYDDFLGYMKTLI